VPDNQRHVNGGSRPVVPVVDVQIGAAQMPAHRTRILNVVDARLRLGHIFQPTDRERRGFFTRAFISVSFGTTIDRIRTIAAQFPNATFLIFSFF